jgi:hypothetical protein
MQNASYVKGVLDLAVYSGVNTALVSAASAGDVDQSSHASGTIASPDGAWVVSVWSDKSGGTTSWTAPAGVSTRATAFGTGGGRYSSLIADTAGPLSAGTYGPISAITNDTSINDAVWTISLPPSE